MVFDRSEHPHLAGALISKSTAPIRALKHLKDKATDEYGYIVKPVLIRGSICPVSAFIGLAFLFFLSLGRLGNNLFLQV